MFVNQHEWSYARLGKLYDLGFRKPGKGAEDPPWLSRRCLTVSTHGPSVIQVASLMVSNRYELYSVKPAMRNGFSGRPTLLMARLGAGLKQVSW